MPDDEGLEDPTGYGRKVGDRLRAIRRQKGLSLQDVEASSTYRKRVAPVLARRALQEAAERAAA